MYFITISGTDSGSHGLEQTTAVISNEPINSPEEAAQSISNDAPGLADFCQFVTGSPAPPHQPIRVRFSSDNSQTLPIAETCFTWLVLPVTSSCFQEFKRNNHGHCPEI